MIYFEDIFSSPLKFFQILSTSCPPNMKGLNFKFLFILFLLLLVLLGSYREND